MAVAALNGRMNWWYDAIIDWMIRNPGQPLYKCADEIGRSRGSIYAIVSSDVFQMALAERKASFRERHDFAIVAKSARLANLALDLQLEQLEKKRDKTPMSQLQTIADSNLARLGYGPKTPVGPGVTVNVGPGAGQNVTVLPVAKDELERARAQLRRAEAAKMIDAIPVDVSPRITQREPSANREAEPAVEATELSEVADAPAD